MNENDTTSTTGRGPLKNRSLSTPPSQIAMSQQGESGLRTESFRSEQQAKGPAKPKTSSLDVLWQAAEKVASSSSSKKTSKKAKRTSPNKATGTPSVTLSKLATAAKARTLIDRKNRKRQMDMQYARKRRQRERQQEIELKKECARLASLNSGVRTDNDRLEKLLADAKSKASLIEYGMAFAASQEECVSDLGEGDGKGESPPSPPPLPVAATTTAANFSQAATVSLASTSHVSADRIAPPPQEKAELNKVLNQLKAALVHQQAVASHQAMMQQRLAAAAAAAVASSNTNTLQSQLDQLLRQAVPPPPAPPPPSQPTPWDSLQHLIAGANNRQGHSSVSLQANHSQESLLLLQLLSLAVSGAPAQPRQATPSPSQQQVSNQQLQQLLPFLLMRNNVPSAM